MKTISLQMFVVFLIFLSAQSTSGLNCFGGYSARVGFFKKSSLDYVDCASNEVCFRMEAEFSITFGSGSGFLGRCMDVNDCHDTQFKSYCKNPMLLLKGLNQPHFSFNINRCWARCCYGDECNEKPLNKVTDSIQLDYYNQN